MSKKKGINKKILHHIILIVYIIYIFVLLDRDLYTHNIGSIEIKKYSI